MEPWPRGCVVEVSGVAGGQETVQNLLCSPGAKPGGEGLREPLNSDLAAGWVAFTGDLVRGSGAPFPSAERKPRLLGKGVWGLHFSEGMAGGRVAESHWVEGK